LFIRVAVLEHFQEFLNRKDPCELAIIPEAPMDLEIDTDQHSKLEIQKAIKSLKNKNAAPEYAVWVKSRDELMNDPVLVVGQKSDMEKAFGNKISLLPKYWVLISRICVCIVH
jgi:hypothetical protein